MFSGTLPPCPKSPLGSESELYSSFIDWWTVSNLLRFQLLLAEAEILPSSPSAASGNRGFHFRHGFSHGPA
jgi:hypothetical protein